MSPLFQQIFVQIGFFTNSKHGRDNGKSFFLNKLTLKNRKIERKLTRISKIKDSTQASVLCLPAMISKGGSLSLFFTFPRFQSGSSG